MWYKCKLKPNWDATIYWVDCLKLKGLITQSIGENVGKIGLLYIAMQMKNCTTTLENDLTVLKNLKICLSYDQAIPLLGIYAREMQVCVQTKACS